MANLAQLGSVVALKTVEMYRPEGNSWSLLPDMNIARASSSGCILKDQLFIFGGSPTPTVEETNFVSTIEKLEVKDYARPSMIPSQAKFELLDIKLPMGLCDMAILPLINDSEVLILGGRVPESQYMNQPVIRMRFNPNEPLEDLITP